CPLSISLREKEREGKSSHNVTCPFYLSQGTGEVIHSVTVTVSLVGSGNRKGKQRQTLDTLKLNTLCENPHITAAVGSVCNLAGSCDVQLDSEIPSSVKAKCFASSPLLTTPSPQHLTLSHSHNNTTNT
ncbi:hypothetical protein Pmani_005561, partial [Petrolisthes manimaculis]